VLSRSTGVTGTARGRVEPHKGGLGGKMDRGVSTQSKTRAEGEEMEARCTAAAPGGLGAQTHSGVPRAPRARGFGARLDPIGTGPCCPGARPLRGRR